jgi:uncharacterized protein (DUF1501 family)
MFNRRQFLTRTLQGSSLLALGSVVPQFVANTARAAQTGKDTVLVVIEMSGGNDGLNTVIPHEDDLYHKYRPTLRYTKQQLVAVDDHIGLNPGMRSLSQMIKDKQLAVVQGVGYPNPDRSHFDSMDIWQMADPKRKIGTGWIGRTVGDLQGRGGAIPALHIGRGRLPLAFKGAPGGAISINNTSSYRLDLGGGSAEQLKARRQLVDDLARPASAAPDDSLLNFVQRRQVQTLTTLERLQEVLDKSRVNNNLFRMDGQGFRQYESSSLPVKLQLVAQLIAKGFGTRIFYVMIDGFDTHSAQLDPHRRLLAELADGISQFFNTLKQTKDDQRVRVMTFSEFGRRVQENGSKGTDHGAASCLFVAGPSVKGGVVGAHPSLKDLDSGDLKHHTDFRSVYATLLDHWLGCDSAAVLGGQFPHVEALKAKA